ncbi:MAG: LA2681 family HEPN domain-containing protein [Candidatus Sulfotelmatobacter sp.]
MTLEDLQLKNKVCDRLMKEGLGSWRDEENVARAALLTDLALELEHKNALACALAWYEALEEKGLSGEAAILLDYNWANAIAGERYGTAWTWEQPTLARELYHLRRAVSNEKFAQMPDVFKCKCLTNLGNRLNVAGRAIEALDCWRRVLEVNPNFGMALCNRAKTLADYANALEDKDYQALFLFFAHREASSAIAPTAFYTAVRDQRNRAKVETLKESIESVVDMAGLAPAVATLNWEDTSATEEERPYRHWCLLNCLYLNPLNDLGRYAFATRDSVGLAAHVVPVDAPHVFESFYDQMKQEYVSARWLLYEGLNAKVPHFSDKDVLLQATEPKPSLSLAIEKVKAAYKAAYSLFDKIGFFMNAYMTLIYPGETGFV